MKTHSQLPPARVHRSRRASLNPVRSLSPESLTRQLDAFHAGHLGEVTRLWEVIEQRDDVVKAVACKRKKAPARFGWDVVTHDSSPEALQHKASLEEFYRNLQVQHAADQNETGGLSLLIRQMMDAVGKRYAVHEIVWRPTHGGQPGLHATLRFVPLWFFENRTGELRFLPDDTSREGQPLRAGEWMITTGDGLMEASSIAYLFKHLPLRDWLIYCERNGMPGVRGVTDAIPGTAEWDSARDAVREFGAEFHALMSRSTHIEAIDLSSSGQLPYPQLVDRMDKAIATLWRGSSMGTVADAGAGISLQGKETTLIEREDITHLSETLHAQLDRWVIQHLYGQAPRAGIALRHHESNGATQELTEARNLLTEALPQAVANFIRKLCPAD